MNKGNLQRNENYTYTYTNTQANTTHTHTHTHMYYMPFAWWQLVSPKAPAKSLYRIPN